MRRTTPRKMMTKRRMPAMTPAIFTVWSVCFSGSTASGLGVAAPAKHHSAWRSNGERAIDQAECGSTQSASRAEQQRFLSAVWQRGGQLINTPLFRGAFFKYKTHVCGLGESWCVLCCQVSPSCPPLSATSALCGSSCTRGDKCAPSSPLVNHVWGKWLPGCKINVGCMVGKIIPKKIKKKKAWNNHNI